MTQPTPYRVRLMRGNHQVRPEESLFNFTLPQLITRCKQRCRADNNITHVDVYQFESKEKLFTIDTCRAFDWQLGQYIDY